MKYFIRGTLLVSVMTAAVLIQTLSPWALNSQPLPVKKPTLFSPQQITCIATAVYHEARGEPSIGQVAVAHVILNRVSARQWGNIPCEVVYQPYQFTNIELAAPDYTSKEWQEALEIARRSVSGFLPDPTGGATHYYAPERVETPWWAKALTYLVDIGGHRFYV